MKPIDSREVELVAHVPDDEKVDNICPKCGADLFVAGVVEVLSDGYSETGIHFENGGVKSDAIETTDFDEQWALCSKCRVRVEHTAAAIIEAFKELHPPKVEEEPAPLLTIEVKTPVLPENMEKLEDGLKDFLNKGIEAVVESTLTGNTIVAREVV
jgi:hypothetical protein